MILCERGVRTFEDSTRNTLDLSIVPNVKVMSHLPIIVDPSHGTGDAGLVPMPQQHSLKGITDSYKVYEIP